MFLLLLINVFKFHGQITIPYHIISHWWLNVFAIFFINLYKNLFKTADMLKPVEKVLIQCYYISWIFQVMLIIYLDPIIWLWTQDVGEAETKVWFVRLENYWLFTNGTH